MRQCILARLPYEAAGFVAARPAESSDGYIEKKFRAAAWDSQDLTAETRAVVQRSYGEISKSGRISDTLKKLFA
mgnify:CR=1 FL=1